MVFLGLDRYARILMCRECSLMNLSWSTCCATNEEVTAGPSGVVDRTNRKQSRRPHAIVGVRVNRHSAVAHANCLAVCRASAGVGVALVGGHRVYGLVMEAGSPRYESRCLQNQTWTALRHGYRTIHSRLNSMADIERVRHCASSGR